MPAIDWVENIQKSCGPIGLLQVEGFAGPDGRHTFGDLEWLQAKAV